ncbi:MAG: hypothetical protein CME34_11325 [Gordonia sp.]|nr:hypothetical protein [Gordonia sp. (in: high G+C Gram-positive bacteria)]
MDDEISAAHRRSPAGDAGQTRVVSDHADRLGSRGSSTTRGVPPEPRRPRRPAQLVVAAGTKSGVRFVVQGDAAASGAKEET